MTEIAAAASRPTHKEIFFRSSPGEWINVSCTCPIGQDHEYADWLALTYSMSPPIMEMVS